MMCLNTALITNEVKKICKCVMDTVTSCIACDKIEGCLVYE